MSEAAVKSGPGATRHFLTFRLDDRHYALPAEDIAEVIRVPGVARVPQSPPGLLGLANLRGAILPVASGRQLLGQPDAQAVSAEARAMVLTGAAPVALAVDAVLELVELPADKIETGGADLATVPGEMVTGAFQAANGGQVVKLLDVQGLLRTAFVMRPRSGLRGKGVAGDLLRKNETTQSHSKMVAFAVAGQEYALPLDAVQEIAAAPAILATIPHSEALVLGVASFRDALLPLLSLRGLLGLARNMENLEAEKVVVTSIRGNLVGLVVDEMRAIFPADNARIEPVPEVLAPRIGGESRIKAIYRGTHGLVSILAPDQLFGENVMEKLNTARTAEQSDTAPSAPMATEQFLVFRLGDEEFGLPIACVEEVARVPETIARVPKTPKFLEGVINLRGEALPVIDQRKRFNMPALDRTGAQRLVVVRTERHLAGLIVDSVSEVLRAPVDAIDETPDLVGETTKLVRAVLNLEAQDRIVLLLDPAELLTRAERGLLDTFAKQKADPRPSPV